jgi:predicted DNA-binding protein with PD1-like motif
MGLQYGIKEVLDTNILDYKTKKPLVFVDYATATTNENNGERLDLKGGRGNAKQMSFDHSKTSTFKLTVPLVDLNLLAILTGDDIQTGVGEIFKREVLTVADNSGSLEINLSKEPVGNVSVFKLEGLRDVGTEVTGGTVSTKKVTFTTGVVAGDEVIAFYQYAAPATSKKVSVKTTKFPKAVEIYGEGLGRMQEDEQDYPVHVHVFKARPQMNFTFTMEGTNATNLELTFDLYEVKDQNGEGQYIDYIFETE